LQIAALFMASISSIKDCVEGFTAFLEKRKPVFTGK